MIKSLYRKIAYFTIAAFAGTQALSSSAAIEINQLTGLSKIVYNDESSFRIPDKRNVNSIADYIRGLALFTTAKEMQDIELFDEKEKILSESVEYLKRSIEHADTEGKKRIGLDLILVQKELLDARISYGEYLYIEKREYDKAAYVFNKIVINNYGNNNSLLTAFTYLATIFAYHRPLAYHIPIFNLAQKFVDSAVKVMNDLSVDKELINLYASKIADIQWFIFIAQTKHDKAIAQIGTSFYDNNSALTRPDLERLLKDKQNRAKLKFNISK